jgi:hypothetical protein
VKALRHFAGILNTPLLLKSLTKTFKPVFESKKSHQNFSTKVHFVHRAIEKISAKT